MFKLRSKIYFFLEKLANKNKFTSKVSEIIKILYISGESFFLDNCFQKASALSYTTILSFVPFVAIVFSILKGLGVQYSIQKKLLQTMTGNLTEIINHVFKYIEQVNASALGIIGICFLLVTVYSLFSTIESSFNHIWGIKRNRPFHRQLTDYFSIIFLSPFLAILSISINSYLKIEFLLKYMSFIPGLARFIIFLIPYVMSSLALFILYIYIPNTRVKWQGAFTGGIIAGSLWQILQSYYIEIAIHYRTAHIIYQSFAQIPLFFLWIYFSWVITLYGAELAFAVQNRKTYFLEIYSKNPSFAMMYYVTILIIMEGYTNFINNKGPIFRESELLRKYCIPSRLLTIVIRFLLFTKIIKNYQANGREEKEYVFLIPIDKLTFKGIFTKLFYYSEENEHFIYKNLKDTKIINHAEDLIFSSLSKIDKSIVELVK